MTLTDPDRRWPTVAAADTYAVTMPGAVLLSSRQSILDVLRALQAVERRMRGQGQAVPPRVLRLMVDLERALADHQAAASAATGTAALPEADPSPSWEAAERVDVETAARLLGVSVRMVRKLAAAGRLAAQKRGGSWELDRADVERAARERSTAA
ncbi:helix-turn-helix domain-containing protein [Geodermatophilus poikilotrophus]|uniref:DNA binding domain-containing protein, excisionase family n=1 Tax=Geodermatophilus poikilotrophus TaxID=1333667 RepID=A0A1I0DMZ2_9ACTN|nr:helix-turn-helix domain-containing protein [Geodermatophilus poikilotrophus]SET33236.1 DNA binding domain-containing protein, excisionase family [Geodermatophilus poikilotrophus]